MDSLAPLNPCRVIHGAGSFDSGTPRLIGGLLGHCSGGGTRGGPVLMPAGGVQWLMVAFLQVIKRPDNALLAFLLGMAFGVRRA